MEKQNKKTKKIFRKIFWPIVHILILFAIVTFAFNYFSIDRFVKRNAKEKIDDAYDEIRTQLDDFAKSGEVEFKLRSSEKLVNQSNNTKVYVYDDNFSEIALFDNTINTDKEMTTFLSDLLLDYELEENVLTTILFNGREYLANTYVVSNSLKIKEKYFVVVQHLTDKAMLLRESSWATLISEGLVLIIVLVTVFLIARDIAKPLIKLSEESEEYKVGKGITIDDKVISTKEETNRKNTIYENVAHDLRTPLVSILGYADGLKSGIIKDKNKACDVILRTGNQLKEMIENILVLSRFDNDTYKGNREELSLVDLIGEQVETVKVIDDNVNVEFENDLEDGGMIVSDRKLLIRIIQNLLSNAIKYAKTKVIVAARKNSSYVGSQSFAPTKAYDKSMDELSELHYTLSVSDDGDGIDSSSLENIFTRYYKGEDGHFGIGLAVVKSSVDYLGGKICVDSEKGKGTTFIVELKNNNRSEHFPS